MNDHLTHEELELYQRRALPAEKLLPADDHLHECEDCRARLSAVMDLEDMVHAYRKELSPAARSPLPIRLAGIAAALVVALGVAVVLDPEKDIRGLTAEQQQTVRTALRDGKVDFPVEMSGFLRGRPEQLMGTAGAGTNPLIAPVSTVVLEERPVFRWTAVPGVREYRVIATTVMDASPHTVRSNALTTATEWQPQEPLRRGRVYEWQLLLDDRSVPAPPEPPARFAVVNREEAERLAKLPESHRVRGVLYAQGFLLDAARLELEAELRAKPESAPIRALLEAIRLQKRPK